MMKHILTRLANKSRVSLLAALIISVAGFAGNRFHYSITGSIRGLKNDSMVIFIRNVDITGKIKPDTVYLVASNDAISLSAESGGLRDAYVVLGGLRGHKNFLLFIEKGIIRIEGDIDKIDEISVTGTPGNDAYTAQRKAENLIYDRIRGLQARYKQAVDNKMDAGKIEGDINHLRDSIERKRIEFISAHPASPASAVYLYVAQDHVSVEQLEQLYGQLSDQVKQSSFLRDIPAKIAARKRSAIGQTAPEFAATDLSGRPFQLSDYRGRYVLLEFWASWCVPCRAESPSLLKAYNRFRDKGFIVIAVSLDDKKEKWLKAIEEDKLPWIHTSDLNAFDNRIAKLYGVQPIPDNFLIDPQGKIIARELRGEQLEEKLIQEIH